MHKKETSVFSTVADVERKQNVLLIKVYSSNFIQLGKAKRFLKIKFHIGCATSCYVNGFPMKLEWDVGSCKLELIGH